MANLQTAWEINHYYSLDEFQNDARLTGFVWHRHYRPSGVSPFYKNHKSASQTVQRWLDKRFVRSGAGYWHFALVTTEEGVIAYRRFVRFSPELVANIEAQVAQNLELGKTLVVDDCYSG